MNIKLLHTADWHLGQRFYIYDREQEHRAFLKWLVNTIVERETDLLLLSGDIFDVANPSASAQRMFYEFIREVSAQRPQLQIIAVAGNHDSATRLEAPQSLLGSFNMSVVGSVKRRDDGSTDLESLILPVRKDGATLGYCMAVPFLRIGDYYEDRAQEGSYAKAIKAFYETLYSGIEKKPGQFVVAMGHLHTLNAEISDSEKGVRGGLDAVPSDAFDKNIVYTALGHIHKGQRVDKRDNVRFSGSPLPLSFSEMKYRHHVVEIEISDEHVEASNSESDDVVRIEAGGFNVGITNLEVPDTVKLIRIGTPSEPLTRDEVIERIGNLPDVSATETGELSGQYPYLEINVLHDAPGQNIKNDIECALTCKMVRLCRIAAHYPVVEESAKIAITSTDELRKLDPWTLFENRFKSKYGDKELPHSVKEKFQEVMTEVNNSIHHD